MIEDNICDMNDPNSANHVEFVRTATNTITGIAFQNNLYYTTSNPEWIWNGATYTSLSSWEGAGVDNRCLLGDPLLNNPGNGGTCSWMPSALTGPQPCPQAYTLKSGSPALGAGVDVSNNGGKDYYGNGVPSTPSIGAQAIASASTSSTLLTFSDSTAADYNAVPSSYQPVSGVTITWDGGGATTHRYGTHTYDGYQDHRSMLARRQSILVQLQGVAACHPYIGLQAASRELGVLPASVNTTKTRGIRSHPKYGLGFMEKAEFSARF